MSHPVHSILLVCTGNTCRSPMAGALLRKRARETNYDFVVQSAGLGAANGCQPTPEAIEVARSYGADLGVFRSQAVTPELIEGADLILTMTQTQLDILLMQYPTVEGGAHTLLGYAYGDDLPDKDIVDPLGSDIEEYRARAEQMDRAFAVVIKRLMQLRETTEP